MSRTDKGLSQLKKKWNTRNERKITDDSFSLRASGPWEGSDGDPSSLNLDGSFQDDNRGGVSSHCHGQRTSATMSTEMSKTCSGVREINQSALFWSTFNLLKMLHFSRRCITYTCGLLKAYFRSRASTLSQTELSRTRSTSTA